MLRSKVLILIASALFFVSPLYGQSVIKVEYEKGPQWIAIVRDNLVFTSSNGSTTYLWRSVGEIFEKFYSIDGSGPGKVLFSDSELLFFTINNDTSSFISRISENQKQPQYSSSIDFYHNSESVILWVTDGTEQGTAPLIAGTIPYYYSDVPQGIRQPSPGMFFFNIRKSQEGYYIGINKSGLDGNNPQMEIWAYNNGKDAVLLESSSGAREPFTLLNSETVLQLNSVRRDPLPLLKQTGYTPNPSEILFDAIEWNKNIMFIITQSEITRSYPEKEDANSPIVESQSYTVYESEDTRVVLYRYRSGGSEPLPVIRWFFQETSSWEVHPYKTEENIP